MTRAQLEHIIRASGAITGATEIVIIGSQAVHAQFPDAPLPLSESIEADVFTFRDPADAEVIDGSIGEESPFHRTFGYYAHGVGPTTACLPAGWQDRLVRIQGPNTSGVAGLCLDVHDLAVSKLIAGREKDLRFVSASLRFNLVDKETLRTRLGMTDVDDARRTVAETRLEHL